MVKSLDRQGSGQQHLTCYIDALDECDDNQVQQMIEFFEELGDRAALAETKVYICFSSRHYPQIYIKRGIKLILEHEQGHGQDLEKYVRGKLRAGKSKAAEEVRNKILQKSAGVFIWVVLVIDILNKEYQSGRLFAVKSRLALLPEKLSELFKDMLNRDKHNPKDLLLCIQWVLYSKRPLRREEYYFALLSELDPEASLEAWNQDEVTQEDMSRFVLSSSKGLAEITKSKKNPTVQFIHESVRDFLLKENGVGELWPEYAENFEALSHEQLKKSCHSSMQVDTSTAIPEELDEESMPGQSTDKVESLQSTVSDMLPFLEYATHSVLHHADNAAKCLPQDNFLFIQFSVPV